MRIPRIRPVAEGGVVFLVGLVILLLIPFQVETIPGMETEMSPSFLPAVIAITLMIAGGGMIVPVFLGPESESPKLITRIQLLRVILSVVLLVAYTYLFYPLGFVVTSGIFIGIFALLFGSRSVVRIALCMGLIPVAVWLFFEKLFRIPLPHGILF